jgi:hypothetical protein
VARGMIKRQPIEYVATAPAIGQARFARRTHDKYIMEAAAICGLAVGGAGGLAALPGPGGVARRGGTGRHVVSTQMDREAFLCTTT